MQQNNATKVFEAERPRLMAICYRMLGERTASEDAVQDTWLRWAATDQGIIRNPQAWLTRVATRIAIDTLRAAQRRRESYVGPWLPEPLVSSADQPLEAAYIQAQECGVALLWAMERLDAHERAAFILREAFDAEYSELAEVLGKSDAACRQMVSRARRRVQNGVPRFEVSKAVVSDLLGRFYAAASVGDIEAAARLLAPDAQAISDGGANARAARRVLIGPDEVTQVVIAVTGKYLAIPGCSTEPCEVNGLPGLVNRVEGRMDSLITLVPDEQGRIARLFTFRAPEKLWYLT